MNPNAPRGVGRGHTRRRLMPHTGHDEKSGGRATLGVARGRAGRRDGLDVSAAPGGRAGPRVVASAATLSTPPARLGSSSTSGGRSASTCRPEANPRRAGSPGGARLRRRRAEPLCRARSGTTAMRGASTRSSTRRVERRWSLSRRRRVFHGARVRRLWRRERGFRRERHSRPGAGLPLRPRLDLSRSDSCRATRMPRARPSAATATPASSSTPSPGTLWLAYSWLDTRVWNAGRRPPSTSSSSLISPAVTTPGGASASYAPSTPSTVRACPSAPASRVSSSTRSRRSFGRVQACGSCSGSTTSIRAATDPGTLRHFHYVRSAASEPERLGDTRQPWMRGSGTPASDRRPLRRLGDARAPRLLRGHGARSLSAVPARPGWPLPAWSSTAARAGSIVTASSCCSRSRTATSS